MKKEGCDAEGQSSLRVKSKNPRGLGWSPAKEVVRMMGGLREISS